MCLDWSGTFFVGLEVGLDVSGLVWTENCWSGLFFVGLDCFLLVWIGFRWSGSWSGLVDLDGAGTSRAQTDRLVYPKRMSRYTHT